MNSLACLALRLITRRALEGRTLAGAAVRDSEQGDIDTVMRGVGGDGTAPVISIYVDETQGSVEGRDLQSANIDVHLLIEVAIAAPVQSTAIAATASDPAAAPAPGSPGNTPPEPEYEIPATSPGLEASLAIIGYQIKRALIDEATVWGRLWTRLVWDIKHVHTYRGADFRKTGVRYAAVQIEIVLGTLQDPLPGEEPIAAWADILAAFDADEDFAHYGAAIRQLVAGQPLPAWRRLIFSVGDTVSDAIAMGYGPLGGGVGDDVVPMGVATIDTSSPDAPAATFTVVEGQPESFEP